MPRLLIALATAGLLGLPPALAQSAPGPFAPVPAESDGVVRACVLAGGEGGAAYYAVRGVDPSPMAADTLDAVDRTVFVTYRLSVGGETVRMAQCTIEGADIDRVIAALRPSPVPAPPPVAVLGLGRTPPEADDVLECSPERPSARWCFYTETATDHPAPAGPWAFVGDAERVGRPLGRVRPALAPFGSLVPRLPDGVVTPLDVLDRKAAPMILMRSERRGSGNSPR